MQFDCKIVHIENTNGSHAKEHLADEVARRDFKRIVARQQRLALVRHPALLDGEMTVCYLDDGIRGLWPAAAPGFKKWRP
jgi:hypothetical protein